MGGDRMWEELWADFEARAVRLLDDRRPRDVVDETILWQLDVRHRFMPHAVSAQALQLPELYSGRPWSACDIPELCGSGARAHRSRWVAFVTVNPSISTDEVFPTRSDRAKHGDALVDFFEERFEPGPIHAPLIHGRAPNQRTASWRRRGRNPEVHRAWGAIDAALAACLSRRRLRSAAPLGRVGALIDVVPWKSAKWARVAPGARARLIAAGVPFLKRTLATHRPAAVVAAGADVQRALGAAFSDVPLYDPTNLQRGALTLDGSAVPYFGLQSPTGPGHQFRKQMSTIAPELCDALGV